MWSIYNRLRGRDLTSGLYLSLMSLWVRRRPSGIIEGGDGDGEEWMTKAADYYTTPQDTNTTPAIIISAVEKRPFEPRSMIPHCMNEVITPPRVYPHTVRPYLSSSR